MHVVKCSSISLFGMASPKAALDSKAGVVAALIWPARSHHAPCTISSPRGWEQARTLPLCLLLLVPWLDFWGWQIPRQPWILRRLWYQLEQANDRELPCSAHNIQSQKPIPCTTSVPLSIVLLSAIGLLRMANPKAGLDYKATKAGAVICRQPRIWEINFKNWSPAIMHWPHTTIKKSHVGRIANMTTIWHLWCGHDVAMMWSYIYDHTIMTQ